MLCGGHQGAMEVMRENVILACLLVVLAGCSRNAETGARGPSLDIRCAENIAACPQDGRLLLMLSRCTWRRS